eukprot:CAMPEP_0182565382 /NCGR_PEP_ID=MMETSP1324-20130603/7118_1 /TAXON_ID=236786 /ORGANISM="Florenciella sp., Strain RCC1587" /LENGTH=335 /DNA_ID=CAMNT_0024779021 /DNA_START=78 /DNA_END=1085 /DNA_ORIENTATION=-
MSADAQNPEEPAKTAGEEPAKASIGRLLIPTPFVVGIATAMSYAADLDSFPVEWGAVWTVAVVSFVIQWIAFIPAAIYDTEHYFDLTGSLTYISLTIYSFVANSAWKSIRSIVLCSMVLVWAMRLGSFLFGRIKKAGSDDRFIDIKKSKVRFFNVWSIQGLWVLLTALPVFAANANVVARDVVPLGVLDIIGFTTWVIGFGIEVISDKQKSWFNADPKNKGHWIDVGLWKFSRHPNYFGEMVLWLGIFLSACSTFVWGQWACAVSPVFVVLLISFISGIPKLEARADVKWGGNPEYEKYKRTTSVLLILPVYADKGPLAETNGSIQEGEAPSPVV